MLTIGTLELKSPLVLAPLSGISDPPYRRINRKFGCELASTTMVSARSLAWRNRKTEKLLESAEGERPLTVQLLGADPDVLLRALENLARFNYDLIDFNAACPVPKVIKKGEGAALLREPGRLGELLGLLVQRSPVPVTAKIRAGWDTKSPPAREIAMRAQDAGISCLYIHGRTRSQGYGGKVSYDIIGQVKQALSIPVIGSGDAFSPVLIQKMFDDTGCDGVAVARGALGNPWIFREYHEYARTGEVPDRPGPDEIIAIALEHLQICCEFHGEELGVRLFRKFFSWYSRGFLKIKQLRIRAFQASTHSRMHSIIEEMGGLGMDKGSHYSSHESYLMEE